MLRSRPAYRAACGRQLCGRVEPVRHGRSSGASRPVSRPDAAAWSEPARPHVGDRSGDWLSVIEAVADKIPYVDLIWNAAHTFIRVPAAAILAYQATTHGFSPAEHALVTVAAAAIAGVAHTQRPRHGSLSRRRLSRFRMPC